MTSLSKCRFAKLPIILALAGSAACASDPRAEGPCALPLPSTSDWSLHDEGAFSVSLPTEYQSRTVQGIDSQVGRWEAPGKQVSYDFGVYSNPLQPNEVNNYPDLVVCQEGGGSDTPRVIFHTSPEGGFAVSAHWAEVRSQSSAGSESLTLEGVVERPDDRAELLAIIASVRFDGSEAGAVAADTSPADRGDSLAISADGTAALTPAGWGPIRIGMTRAEVVAAAGEDANPEAVGGPEPEACDEFRPQQAPPGLLVMVERDTVTRITLSEGSGIETERGFGVGDEAAAIEQAYGAEAVISPHKYSPAPAEYITVWKTAPGGPDARGLVYEIGTDGRVVHVHAGGPSIQYVEGCL